MLSTPLWAANGEAMQRGEYAWVKKATKNIMLISLGLSTAASVGVILLIKPALFILSDGVVAPDYPLLSVMCLMQIVTSITSPYFMTLNAAGIIKYQIVTYAIYALISLPLKFVLGEHFGMLAITWVGVITYALLLTIPTIYQAKKHIKDKMRLKPLLEE